MSYIYLASPYSDPDPKVEELRYLLVRYRVAALAAANEPVFSPIVHWHHVAKEHNLPKDAAYWATINYTMLSHASTLEVYRLPRWQESIGVQKEIQWADELNIPVRFADV